MKAKILKINKKDSARGGLFYYVFLKGFDGKSYRTCISSEFGNFKNWVGIKPGMILDGLSTGGFLVDADSDFRIVSEDPIPGSNKFAIS